MFRSLTTTLLTSRKPTKAQPNLFAFMEPLNADVWMFIVLAYFIVSFLLFILAR